MVQLVDPDIGDSIYGHNVFGQMVGVAQMNLVLHGVPRARIRRANALSE